MRYYAMRNCYTGLNQYGFFRGKDPLGKATCLVAPDFPVKIQGRGLNLTSEFDRDATIFPGQSRNICRENTGEVYAKIIYHDTGVHSLHTVFDTIHIRSQEDTHRFYREGRQIALISKISPEDHALLPQDVSWELRYMMMSQEEISDSLALLLLNFPILQFAR